MIKRIKNIGNQWRGKPAISNKFIRQYLAVLTLTLTALLSLTGCLFPGRESGGAPVTTITVWTGMTHSKEFMETQVSQWNRTVGKEKNLRIEYLVKENIDSELELAFRSGQVPDMFSITGGGAEYMELFVNEGRVEAIEDLPGGAELVAKYRGRLSNYKHTYKGKTYILPNGTLTYGLVYNKDLFRQAGLVDENGEAKPPATLAEMREYARILTDPEKGRFGFILPGSYSDCFSDVIMKPSSALTGFLYFNPVTGRYDFSGAAKVMETVMNMKADGSCLPGVEMLDNDPARVIFADGNIGMYFSASYDYGVFTSQFPAKIDWGVAPYPAETSAAPYKQVCGSNRFLAIHKGTAEKKGAENVMEVYQWFYSDELTVALYQGGYTLPLNFSLVSGFRLEDHIQKQWREYAALLEVSVDAPMEMPVDTEGARSISEIWIEDIWSGKIPIDRIGEVCAKQEEIMNTGIERYKASHPDFEPGDFIIPDWESQSKRE